MKRLALQFMTLVAGLRSIAGFELSGQQLTRIRTSKSNSSLLSFSFYSGNSLITTVSASALAQATTLQLQNNSLTNIPALLFQAANNVTSIDVSNNPLTELEATSFVNMLHLQQVTCTNTHLTVIPTNLASACPLLTIMAFNQSAIHTVESHALVNLPRLETIALTHNNVSMIYDDSLVNLTALHTLDMSYNELKTVPRGLLTASTSWKVLDCSHNQILDVPIGIQKAVVQGYISLDYNALVEIDEEAMAGASQINELRLASNSIFTIHARAFAGMSALRVLNLSDNVISVIDKDAFEDVDGLTDLRLDNNNLRRLMLSSVPANLERLELQANLIHLMPNFPDNFKASRLQYLNLSHNLLWSVSANDALAPYTSLVTLDLSNNRIVNFSAAVFDPIMSSIKSMNFDSNLITSIPSTNFIALVNKLLTNVTLLNNPGIGWSPDVKMHNNCPTGSVFEKLNLSSSSSDPVNTVSLFGCIQCVAGTFHDNSTGACVPCRQVSSRAYSDQDGATFCLYCPYSSDLKPDHTKCKDFECNTLCWLTLSMGFAIPGMIFSSKLLLYLIMKHFKRTRRVDIEEQEALNDWRMGLMMQQLAEPRRSSDSLLDEEVDEEASEHCCKAPFRIYDLPGETKDLVLSTLRDYFQIRKEKRWRALSLDEQEATSEWNDVEWETFHMHRILSRSYHGEVFLGDYCGAQVVVKRMMTLRFEVKELVDTIKDVELVSSFHHPNVVTCMGTMWSDPEHLCVISEYVKGGDLAAILEVNGLDCSDRCHSPWPRVSASSPFEELRSEKSERTQSQHEMSKTSLVTRFEMIWDVCKALVYLHDMGISHSDLRSRKVLVTEFFRCKLADTRHHSRDAKYHATHIRLVQARMAQHSGSDEEEGGHVESVQLLQSDKKWQAEPTLPLVAPEVLHHNSRHINTDVYSVGILLLELWFHAYIFVQTIRANDELETSSRSTKGLTPDGKEIRSETRPATAHQANKEHNATTYRFMKKLRMLANVDSTEPETEESGGDSSSTHSLSSSRTLVGKVSRVLEDCLQSNPKKRPTAKKLTDVFQRFLDELTAPTAL